MPVIEYVNVKDLHNSKNNPRKIDKDQFEKLCANIEADKSFFESRPILVNSECPADGKPEMKLTVYAGNQRLRAAKKLGWKTVPCIIDHELPEEVIKRRTVLDNLHHGEFDWDILANEYDPLELVTLGMDPANLLGHFDDEEKESKPKGKKAKSITCPSCGHEFNSDG